MYKEHNEIILHFLFSFLSLSLISSLYLVCIALTFTLVVFFPSFSLFFFFCFLFFSVIHFIYFFFFCVFSVFVLFIGFFFPVNPLSSLSLRPSVFHYPVSLSLSLSLSSKYTASPYTHLFPWRLSSRSFDPQLSYGP